MTYSVAIRTLGTNPDLLKKELVSIWRQTILPERVIIYIALDYPRPSFTIGKEEYVWVKKGMVSQRALRYDEINSSYILLLDDDVELAEDSAEKMLGFINQYKADCIGADTFKNQDLPLKSKLFAAITNLVFPHISDKWAFIIHKNGSFSYNIKPKKSFYYSQSCAGPCSMWNKASLLSLHWEDEAFLEKLGFAYGDDALEFYKLYVNGGKLGILYDSGVTNLDGKTASGVFQRNINKYYVRSFASFVIWHRIVFSITDNLLNKIYSSMLLGIKVLWLFVINLFAGIAFFQLRIPVLYCKGIFDAVFYVKSSAYKNIPSFLLKDSRINE